MKFIKIFKHILICMVFMAIFYPIGLLFGMRGNIAEQSEYHWLIVLLAVVTVIPIIYCLFLYSQYKTKKKKNETLEKPANSEEVKKPKNDGSYWNMDNRGKD